MDKYDSEHSFAHCAQRFLLFKYRYYWYVSLPIVDNKIKIRKEENGYLRDGKVSVMSGGWRAPPPPSSCTVCRGLSSCSFLPKPPGGLIPCGMFLKTEYSALELFKLRILS
jgi:hypothetical protein